MADDNQVNTDDQTSSVISESAISETKTSTTKATTGTGKPCKTFCDPSANVIFRSADDVIFRVHDFYLKAARCNSQFFRDMLENSILSSNEEHPIPVSESSQDFRIMLLIITGRPQDVLGLPPTSWDHAVRLYRLVDKYQLDGHQHWFSELCAEETAKTPVQALIIACSRPSIDITLARYAIAEGFSKTAASKMYDPKYFKYPKTDHESTFDPHCRVVHLLDSSNMKLQFRIQLGFKGSMAYSHTFTNLAQDSGPNWNNLANRFVSNIRYIDNKLDRSA